MTAHLEHAQQDPLLDKFVEQVAAQDVPHVHRREALFDVCCLLTVQGVALVDLTPAALLHYAHESRRVRAILHPGNTKYANRFNGLSAWNVLHRMGHFPADTPATMRAALHRGQLSVELMVARYPIRNRAVRQLLLDYFHRRAADTDYASLANLVLLVAHHFWEKIERLNPDQADLRIVPDLYARWRELIRTRDDGNPRAGQELIVIAVRACTTTCTRGRPRSPSSGGRGWRPARCHRPSYAGWASSGVGSTTDPPTVPANGSRCYRSWLSTSRTTTTRPAPS